jgi:glutathione-specific gamma-glutamylcyclotransferase
MRHAALQPFYMSDHSQLGNDPPSLGALHEMPPLAPLRDPAELLARTWRQWDPRNDLWVFGYASLIWRPEFHADEQRPARVWGYHRSFRMRSRVNRGTPAVPGLVFALLSGGSCRGMVYRVTHQRAEQELERLWAREMPTGVYDPRWLPCSTTAGPVTALAFTLPRSSPSYTGAIDDTQMLQILRTASGRYGTTLEYLLRTAQGLRQHGIRDREIERLAAMSRRHGLHSLPAEDMPCERA